MDKKIKIEVISAGEAFFFLIFDIFKNLQDISKAAGDGVLIFSQG